MPPYCEKCGKHWTKYECLTGEHTCEQVDGDTIKKVG